MAGVWQWVVDVGPGVPALTVLLRCCYGFLVDDDCGRAVGVVEGVVVGADEADPMLLLVVQGWGRRRIMASTDDVLEVAPGGRRLVIACRDGHLPPDTDHPAPQPWRLADAVTAVRSIAARLVGRRT